MPSTQQHMERVLQHQQSLLLKAIGVENLIQYFKLLDEVRDCTGINMYFGGPGRLQRKYPGMTATEAITVVAAWMSQSDALPPEDRACNVISD